MPKTVPARQGYLPFMYCSCSHARLVEVFCEDHNDVCCSDCRLISHRNCTTTGIDKRYTSSIENDLNAILKQTNDIEKKAQIIQELHTKCHASISESEAKCNVKIKTLSERLHERIGTLTQNANVELKKHRDNESKIIEEQEAVCQSALQRLAKDREVLQESKNARDGRQMFVSVLKFSPIIGNYHQLFHDLNEKCRLPKIDFVKNRALEDIQNIETSLGHLIVDSQSTTGKTPCNILNMSLVMHKTKDVTPAKVRRLTGSAFLPNGDLIVCDCDANTLLLLDRSFKLKSSAEVNSPWDVAPLGNNEIAVTLPVARKLQFFKIEPKLKLGRFIEIGENCYGVDILNNEIYVSCWSGDNTVRIFDIGGTLKRKVGILQNGQSMFDSPLHLAVSRKTFRLFVSECTSRKPDIVCLSPDGEVLQKYGDTKQKYPRGILLDQNDNFLVCNDDGDNSVISVYKADSSKKNKTLLTCNENIKNPYCIRFRDSDSSLIVVCEKKILAFTLQ